MWGKVGGWLGWLGWFSPIVFIFCLSSTPRWMCFFWLLVFFFGGCWVFCRGLVKNQLSNTVRCLYFFCYCKDRWRWLNPIRSFVYFWVTRIWVTRRRAKWGPISAYGGKGWRLERWRSLSVDEVTKTLEQKQLNKSLNDILNLPSPTQQWEHIPYKTSTRFSRWRWKPQSCWKNWRRTMPFRQNQR